MSEGKKSWTPEDLINKIKEVAGNVVAEKLEPLQRTVTDHKSWISGAEASASRRVELVQPSKGMLIGAMVGALALTKGNPKEALEMQKTRFNTDKSELQGSLVKALEATTVQGGGAFIPQELSTDFIDILTPRAVVRSFGTVVVPMTSGGMTVPKMTAASSAYYIGESQQPTKSQQAFGLKKLNARKLGVLVPISNDLLRRGGAQVGAIVRNDLVRSAALKEDVSFIRSQGSEYTPKGLRYQAAAANLIPMSGSTSYDLDSVTADLGNLILALEEANVGFSNPGWVFSPRTAMYLMTVRDGLGNYAFRAEMLTGKFWGWPFKKTTQIPRNLGSGGAESEVYLADFDDVVIGDTMTMQIATSEEASYKDESGNLVSAYSLDQTVMRCLLEHDIALRHDESVAVLTGVLWTPGGGA